MRCGVTVRLRNRCGLICIRVHTSKQELDEHAQKLIAEKKAEFVERTKQTDAFAKSHFPEAAQLCAKCSTAAVVMMDGCMTCLNCGDSKCG